MQIISRKEAIAQGLIRYFTGKPCRHGHIDEKYVINRGCCVCSKMRYELNFQKHRAAVKAWRDANPGYARRRYAKLALAYRALRELGIEI